MTIEYQQDLLRFFYQSLKSKRYILDFNFSIFDLREHQIAFTALQEYVRQYHVLPKKNSIREFIINTNQFKKLDADIQQVVLQQLNRCFMEIKSNDEMLIQTIILNIKRKLTTDLVINYADKLVNATDSEIQGFLNSLGKVANLGNTENSLAEGSYLFRDFSTNRPRGSEVHPLFLKGVNNMTAAGGFFKPQIILWVGPPKGFKTGFLLYTALNYAIDGLQVFYADTENGMQPLLDRLHQEMLHVQWSQLISGKFDASLIEMTKRCRLLGGDIRVQYFPAGAATIEDVDNVLEELSYDNFKPRVIIYDYFDKFDSDEREKRLKIQSIFNKTKALNVKRDMLAFSVSQIKQSALGKPVFDMGDLNEDWMKVGNADAAFAICGTEDEIENGIRRIAPCFQRQGIRYESGCECFVKVDESQMLIQELSEREVLQYLNTRVEIDPRSLNDR